MVNYKIGDIVSGKVTGVEDYGIFLLVDDKTTGLIHISEISDSFVRDVSHYAKVGDIIKAEVIEYDEETDKLKLSIKKTNSVDSKQKRHIIETSSGFSGLSKQLDNWIEIKEKELDKKIKKNCK